MPKLIDYSLHRAAVTPEGSAWSLRDRSSSRRESWPFRSKTAPKRLGSTERNAIRQAKVNGPVTFEFRNRKFFDSSHHLNSAGRSSLQALKQSSLRPCISPDQGLNQEVLNEVFVGSERSDLCSSRRQSGSVLLPRSFLGHITTKQEGTEQAASGQPPNSPLPPKLVMLKDAHSVKSFLHDKEKLSGFLEPPYSDLQCSRRDSASGVGRRVQQIAGSKDASIMTLKHDSEVLPAAFHSSWQQRLRASRSFVSKRRGSITGDRRLELLRTTPTLSNLLACRL